MKIALLTGASSGIGREFAIQLDKMGECDQIWLIARRKERLEELATHLTTPTRLFQLDLQKDDSITEIEQALITSSSEIKFVVNAAGFGLNGDFIDLNRSEQLQMIDLNCRSVIALTHMTIHFMKKGSRFYNISSIAGASPLGAFALYGASKAFLTSFSVGIASELKPLGIGMTIVTPGSVDTEFQSRARGKNNRKKKLFSTKATANAVVSQAIKDAEKGRLFSVYGLSSRIALLISKILTQYQSARFAYTKIYPKS